MASRISRAEAWSLLSEWVRSESLRRHCLAVEAALVALAERDGHDAQLWAVTGLLHDADYERFPDMDDERSGHPRTIIAELERRGAPPEMVHAIAAHASFLGVAPETELDRALLAVDELCGFLAACAYVRPDGIRGLTPRSVRKKLRQPSFAAAVSREDVRAGAELLGADFDQHVAFVIDALSARADELGLGARTAGAA